MTFEENQIQKALNNLDRDLFLDKRHSPLSGVYYVVCYPAPGEPMIVVDWREGIHPKPLSLDLVDRVRSQEGDISESIAQATANNAARKELMRQKRLQEQEEVVEEWQKSGRSTGIPKPSYLVVPKDIPKTDSK